MMAHQDSSQHDQSELLKRVGADSTWLFAGYAVTSGIGFFAWLLAARLISPAELGIQAALVSIFSAAAVLAGSGIASAVVVMIPGAGNTTGELVAKAYRWTIVAASVIGLAAGIIVDISLDTPHGRGKIVLIIASATVVWSLFNLQSQIIAGFGRMSVTVAVNVPANLTKLVLIALFVWVGFSDAFVWATVVPAAVAVLIVSGRTVPRWSRASGATVEDVSWRRDFLSFAWRDNTAIVLTTGVGVCLTYVTTALAGPEQGAVFALCYQFFVVLDLVSVGLATALARNTSLVPDEARNVRVGLRLWFRAVALIVAGGCLIVAASPVFFAIVDDLYVDLGGTAVLATLIAATAAKSPMEVWAGLLRARRRVHIVMFCNAIWAATVVVGVCFFAPAWGARGTAAALLCASVLVGAIGLANLASKGSQETV